MVRLILSYAICFLFFAPPMGFSDEAQQRIIERYREILAKSPKQGTTFDRVYDYYVDTGQSAQFYQECQSAAQTNPSDAKTQLLFGLVAQRRNQIAEAAAAFQTAAELEPENFLPMLYLGELFLYERKLAESVASLEQAHSRLQNNTSGKNDKRTVLQTLATAYTRNGETQKSLDTWNQLADLFPNDPDIMAQVAESMEFEGKLDEALKQYRKLIQQTADPGEKVRLSLAAIDIMFRQGDNQTAINELNALLEILNSESYLADAVRNRIDRIFEHMQEVNRHIEFYQRRIKKAPHDTGTLLRLVQILQRADKSKEAETLLFDMIKVSPSNILLRLTLIDLLVNRNDISSALQQFQEIARSNSERGVPLETEHLIRWGSLALQHSSIPESERRAEAVSIWNRIVEKTPNDPNVIVSVAELFAKYQFYAEAERCFKRAVLLRPDDFSYRESLATFYEQQDRKEEIATALLPEDQKFIAAHCAEIGQRLLGFGLIPEAEQMLRNAVQAEPQNPTLQCRYLETLLRQRTPESDQFLQHFFTNIEEQITDDESFALFLQQEMQLLQTQQRTAQAIKIVQAKLDTLSSMRSFWHLAMLHQAEMEIPLAVYVAEKAMNQSAPPLPFFRFLAELYERNGNTDKAIALYQKLVQDDPPRSGDYWQQIITLQVQQGEVPLALESSQKLLGHGTENAERLRFVAELFLSVNRRSEAVKLLQQALILEPGNTDVLRVLVQTYIDSEQHVESVELLWRLYDRLKEFSPKLSVIEMLASEYSKQGKGDELLERLQQLSRNYEYRIGAMQALVRVFIFRGEDNEAQMMLENLLALPVYDENNAEAESVKHWVFRELVGLAEKREDFAAAVRYQEMLCRILSDSSEQNHLFELYVKLGNTEKTQEMFFDQVLLQGNIEDKFKLIDTMIQSRQYEAVSKVLDFLSVHEPDHWGIMFRQILAEAYQNRPVESLVLKFRSSHYEPTSVNPQADFGFSETFVFGENAPSPIVQSLGLQDVFLPIIFLPEILNDGRLQGQHFSNLALADVPSFEEARFLVLGFLLREAMNKDFAMPGDNPTVMRQFRTAINVLREMLPADASKYDVLMERLRLEVWLMDLLKFNNDHALFSDRLELQIDERLCQQNIEQVIRKAALDGASAWNPVLFQILTMDCFNELITNQFKRERASNIGLSATLTQILDTLCQQRKLSLSAQERKDMISYAVFLIEQSEKDHQASLRTHSLTLAQKTDHLLMLWQEFNGERIFTNCYGMFHWILTSQNRTADVQMLEQSIRKTAQEKPSWYASCIDYFDPAEGEIVLFNGLSNYDSLETKLRRTKENVVQILPFCTRQRDKESFCTALFDRLEVYLMGYCLKRYDLFTPADQESFSIHNFEQVWAAVHGADPSQQGQFVRQLYGIESAPVSHRLVLLPEQMNRLVELEHALQQFADLIFYVLGTLKIEPSDIAPPGMSPNSHVNVTLSRYRPELQGDRPIDRSAIYSLIEDPFASMAKQFSTVEELFCRILLLHRAMDAKTKFAGLQTENRVATLPSHYTEHFRQFLENKKRSTVESDRIWSHHFSLMLGDLLTKTIPTPGQEPNPNAELSQLAQKLESEQKNRTLASAEKLALALLYVRLQRYAEAVQMLDMLEFTAALDLQTREWIIAQLAVKFTSPETPQLLQRGNEAADKLLNYRLSERDSLALIPILQKLGRKEESQQIWDRLAETVIDRRLLATMLYEMESEGSTQNENAAKIARRILLNPAFLQNTFRLTQDVRLMESAVKVLQAQNQTESVLPIVENRLQGLRDQTDSRILRARLFLMLDRQEDARNMALELAQNPTLEPERRQMIVSLLVHFGLQKELETMNRLLLEQKTGQ